jgi:hypothetical protein
MVTRKSSLFCALVLAGTGLMSVSAKASLLGSSLGWQYYGGGGPYNPGGAGTETNGTFTDDGSVGGTYIGLNGDIPVAVFNIEADATSITFDYSVDEALGPWTPSPFSLAPTISNGIAINLLSDGAFTAVSIDTATNMSAFGISNVSFSDNQIQVDWQNLPFDTTTVVKLDVTSASASGVPEPGTFGLLAFCMLGAGLAVTRTRCRV